MITILSVKKKQEADIEQGLWDFYYFQLIRRLGCPVGKLTNFENKLETLHASRSLHAAKGVPRVH